ncbi:hypothetical protein CR513_45295, partial [Mucuna pruriens]
MYHFIRECIVKKEVELVHVKTQDQVTNIFTKLLKFEGFRILRARLDVRRPHLLGKSLRTSELNESLLGKYLTHSAKPHNLERKS